MAYAILPIVKPLCIRLGAIPLALLPFVLAGCGAATPAQVAAAQKLADDCYRDAKDDSMEFITVEGGSVRLNLTNDQWKRFEATKAQDVSADNLGDLANNPSYMEGMGIGMGILSDSKCLGTKSGVPTDTYGVPKAGDWPDWRVTLDQHGNPVLTSTVEG